jgi:hypothetical protein
MGLLGSLCCFCCRYRILGHPLLPSRQPLHLAVPSLSLLTMTYTRSSDLPPVDSAAQSPDATGFIESYANSLMDELFINIEEGIEGQPQALEALERYPNPMGLGEQTDPANSAIVPVTATPALDTAFAPNNLAAAVPPAPAPSPSQGRWKQVRQHPYFWTIGSIAAVAATLIAGLGAWLAHSQTQVETTVGPADTAVPASDVAASGQDPFLEYLRRSIDVIGQSEATAGTATATANSGGILTTVPVSPLADGGSGLPPLPGASGSSNALGSDGPYNVIERVYIPVYQPPTAAQPPAAPAAPAPTSPSNGPTAAAPSPAPIPNVAPANIHTLVGVLELGERSAALFEINNVAYRVYVGEPIGSSGWTLVSVANQEAVVRRNGEVRSVYMGQRF